MHHDHKSMGCNRLEILHRTTEDLVINHGEFWFWPTILEQQIDWESTIVDAITPLICYISFSITCGGRVNRRETLGYWTWVELPWWNWTSTWHGAGLVLWASRTLVVSMFPQPTSCNDDPHWTTCVLRIKQMNSVLDFAELSRSWHFS